MEVPFGYNLEGRVAIVTGGGAAGEGIGNGRAAAILLARAGCRVLVIDRSGERARDTVAMIAEDNGVAEAFEADVTSEDECREAVDFAVETFGHVDVLDNNVGVGSRGSVVDETLERWKTVMSVNVESMFLMSKYAVPAMARSGGGSIINVSSISAIRPRGLTAYSTSKGAVMSLTRAMAVDHAADGIRVNCLLPGPVYTPLVYSGGMSEEARETRKRSSLLQVEGTGWDVGQAVLFLASDMSRYMTGQNLIVDGGVTLRGPERDTR